MGEEQGGQAVRHQEQGGVRSKEEAVETWPWGCLLLRCAIRVHTDYYVGKSERRPRPFGLLHMKS